MVLKDAWRVDYQTRHPEAEGRSANFDASVEGIENDRVRLTTLGCKGIVGPDEEAPLMSFDQALAFIEKVRNGPKDLKMVRENGKWVPQGSD